MQLGRSEKDVLDLLAAGPMCRKEQLAGLMGGVTRRRADQVLSSLTGLGLVRADGRLHVLTDEGLTHLARRDRAAVSLTLSRWSARTGRHRHKQSKSRDKVYFGTSLRVMASQMEHHAGITDFAAALTAEIARTPGYELLGLMPTSRSSAGYWYMGANYVVHPDASFQLGYMASGITTSWSTSAEPLHRSVFPPNWSPTADTSGADGPAGTTAGCYPECSSSSSPQTARRPSWTSPTR